MPGASPPLVNTPIRLIPDLFMLYKLNENYAKCKAIFEQEELHSQEVYDGDASIGKRALQRVLMRKKLEQMGVELRELMVYQSPPELGALYTEVEAMMKEMGKTQKVLIARKMKQDLIDSERRRKRLQNS